MVATIGEYCFKGRHKVTAFSLPKVTSIGTGGLGAGSEDMTVMIGDASGLTLTNKLFTYDEEQVSAPQITMAMRPLIPPDISNDTFKTYSSGTVVPYRVVVRNQQAKTDYIVSWRAHTPFSRANQTVLNQWFVVNQ